MIAFAVTALLALFGGAYLLLGLPSLAEQLSSEPLPLIVSLLSPNNGSRIPLNHFTTVRSEALSQQPIAALEFWVDGMLVNTSLPPQGEELTRFSGFWTWTPDLEGEHLLQVRALDLFGASAFSNTVRVHVGHEADVFTELVPMGSHTLGDVAGSFGVDPQNILETNPGLNQEDPLPSERIKIPLPEQVGGASQGAPSPPPSPQGPFQPLSVEAPGPIGYWLAKNLDPFFGSGSPPQTPSLSALVDGCDAQLFMHEPSGNALGFSIYRSDPISGDFALLTTKAAGDGPSMYVDEGLYGTIGYYIEAFNPVGKTTSSPASVQISDPTCLKGEWVGFGVSDGQLIPSQAVDRAYCYLSTAEGFWSRIPFSPASFFKPLDSTFDIGMYLQDMTFTNSSESLEMVLDCWGWVGSSLHQLGVLTLEIPRGADAQVEASAENIQFVGKGGATLLGGGLPDVKVPAPHNLRLTHDIQACVDHAGIFGLFCEASLKNKADVLVWEWEPGCWANTDCDDEIGGYKVYEIMSEGPNVLRKTIQHADTKVFVDPFLPSQGQWGGPIGTDCYVVTAFAEDDGQESQFSNIVCTGPPGYPTTTLTPADYLYGWAPKQDNCGSFIPLPWYDPSRHQPVGIVAGYEHYEGGCDYRNLVYRGAVWFDISQIPGPILKAYLRFHWVGGNFFIPSPNSQPPPPQDLGPASCAAALMLGSLDWRDIPNPSANTIVPAVDYIGMTPYAYPQAGYQFDVTDVVQDWQQGVLPNYGFVLRGPDETLEGKLGSTRCMSDYWGFTLEVEHLGE